MFGNAQDDKDDMNFRRAHRERLLLQAAIKATFGRDRTPVGAVLERGEEESDIEMARRLR